MNYKFLKDCAENEWVYCEYGTLCCVKSDEVFGKTLTDGYVSMGYPEDYKVFPITVETKIIAETIKSYADDMFKNNLINGSRWTSWLYERFIECMELLENKEYDKIQKIYDEIRKQIDKIKSVKYKLDSLIK